MIDKFVQGGLDGGGMWYEPVIAVDLSEELAERTGSGQVGKVNYHRNIG